MDPLTIEAIALLVALTLGVALVVVLLGLLGLRLGRRWSLTAQLFIVVLAPAAGIAGSALAAAQAMYLSQHDLAVLIWLVVISALVSLGIAVLLGRSFMRNTQRLLSTTRALGEEGRQQPAEHRSSELEALARELAATGDRLRDARLEVQRMEASRRELVAWVSHDLRTPLASVRAMAEALEDGMVEEPQRYHRDIRSQVDRLSALVDDLFELSKLHAGHLQLNLAPVSVFDLLSDAVAELLPLATARDVRVRLVGDGSMTIVGDQRELSRVVGNLLVNALHHASAGSTVSIAVDPRGEDVRIRVTDVGDRISEADLLRVWDAGWRGDPARAPDGDLGRSAGAGLGLTIVKGIVTAHGGAVAVANTADGSCFTVTLPLDPTRTVVSA